ncbi:MAG TPA: L-lactate permease, partial [Tepidisphaeraceae bacterium]
MSWTQTYTPLGGLFLSALVASLPVVVLLGLLATSRIPAHFAALLGLATSLAVAIFVYGMPARLASFAAIDGAAYGLFPIGWIVLCAIFVYDITVHTGQFEIVKRSIAGIADDRRIQAILIAFSFGAFIEGAAGFGTPVAISAAMLIGLGFRPLSAASLALIGNTAPVAFGALGTPVIALAKVTGIPAETLSAMVGRQLPFFSLLIPFWLVCAMCGFRSMLEVWPACLTAGLVFGLVQFAVSNFHGPWVVDIAASLASIFALLLLLRFWQPRSVWRFDHERGSQPDVLTTRPTTAEAVTAWTPWVIVSVIVFIWGLPQAKAFLNNLSSVNIPIPYLDHAVSRAPPV